jgi:hypothetical protein
VCSRLCHRGPPAAWRRSHRLDPASVSSSSTCTRTGTLLPSWCAAPRGRASRPSPSQWTLLVWDAASLTSRTGTITAIIFSEYGNSRACPIALETFSPFLCLCLVVVQVCLAEAPDLGQLRGFGPRTDGQGRTSLKKIVPELHLFCSIWIFCCLHGFRGCRLKTPG